MNHSEFENEIMSGHKFDNVSNEALEFFANHVRGFSIINKSATRKGEKDQKEFVSISTPKSGDRFNDEELIDIVKNKLVYENSDIQKNQMRVNGKSPTKVEIWRHGYGYSAFADR